jgi:uncharacterized protein
MSGKKLTEDIICRSDPEYCEECEECETPCSDRVCTEYNCTDCDCTDCKCTDCGCPNCDHKEEIGPVKIRYSYDKIHKLFQENTTELRECDYDYIIAIGGGGLIPARMLRNVVNVPIIVVTLKFYDDDDHISSDPEIIQWDSDSISRLGNKKCLIVDEVYDTGSTMRYVVDRLTDEGVKHLSALVIHHKIKDSNTDNTTHIGKILKNYHPLIQVSDQWIVYPWEANDIEAHNEFARSDINIKLD